MCELTKNIKDYTVNKETGEVTGAIYEGDMIVRKNSISANNEYDKNFNNGVGFLKIFYEVLPELKRVLSKSEFSSMMLILPYISFDDCILKNEDESVVTLKDFPNMFNLSYERSRKIVKVLLDNGIIGKFERGYKENPKKKFKCYVFNPFIATKNKAVNKTVISMFKDSNWGTKQIEDIR